MRGSGIFNFVHAPSGNHPASLILPTHPSAAKWTKLKMPERYSVRRGGGSNILIFRPRTLAAQSG